jgi:KDO2-lipid IV(A) lauroyltransferase
MNLFLLFCIKVISFFSYYLGRPVSRTLFSILGIIWFDVLRVRRKDIIKHIGIAFPEMPMDQKIKLGRKNLLLTTANLADLFSIPYINQKWIDKYVVFEGCEHVEDALKLGKGILMLGMHVGNGDVSANLIAMKNWPIQLITKFFKNKKINDIWFSVRGAQGVNYIEPHGEKAPFQILKGLKSNGVVVFVSDQFMGKPYGVPTNFFGVPTGTAQGLALFHIRSKAPVVPVYCYEGDDNKFHLVFEPALQLSAYVSEDKEIWILNLTQHFCDVIERIVRAHPAHWMWLHRRWKKFE